MSDIKIQPSGSGTAVVTLTAPTTNTARTITFPDATGTLLNSGSTLDATKLSGNLPAISAANLTAIPAANITGTLPALAATNLTSIPAANITGTLPAISGANLTGLSTNTPSFSVYAGATLAMASVDTWYKTVYSNESWDTNSCIAQGSGATDNRFICPTGHAGKYLFNYGAHMTFSSGSAARMSMRIKKNDVLVQEMWSYNDSHQRAYGSWSVVIDMAVNDYVEVFASWAGYGWSSSSLFLYAGTNNLFQGYKLT